MACHSFPKQTEDITHFTAESQRRGEKLLHQIIYSVLNMVVLDNKSDQKRGLSCGMGNNPIPNICLGEIGQVIL
jgi:hypothetical protein